MKLIGLTGGIATGKSSVSSMIRDMGVPVLDADVFAREVVEPGSFGLRTIVEVFGKEILSGERLNRSALGEKIFADENSRLTLERILHPLIQWRLTQEARRFEREGRPLVFYDAALIYEKNLVSRFDAVVVITAPYDVQKQRLMKRSQISSDAAEKRLSTQWPLEKKTALAHHVIDNSGSLENTRKQVKELLSQLS